MSARPEAEDRGLTLVKTQLRGGVWEGVLSCATGAPTPPALEIFHPGGAIEDFTLEPVPGEEVAFLLRIPLGRELISDGVHLVTIAERETGTVLGRVTIAADADETEDLRAEVRLLRAELDMLKRAFRRHCVETGAM
ncbi:hypothetical protein SAMN05216257_10176 [Meinhardsimonia xiamenensis]|jgi:hypothetical protein|uniref:Uncharacterized protein n=1 Tax=Meinhardsimonia xiamenensis TaxID=990712 RepID=A0A1G8XV61_9RHOB|nr:hypothetical protein [Meinhardsimonia xiamenensis]PRX37058.1 hypothetical protein LV81_00832 [Meinhardsimonia xiamenensis]SDJ94428.1 hypothetical protein SAMN05216257_10176 [Meinhardsimonia xiamenensis]